MYHSSNTPGDATASDGAPHDDTPAFNRDNLRKGKEYIKTAPSWQSDGERGKRTNEQTPRGDPCSFVSEEGSEDGSEEDSREPKGPGPKSISLDEEFVWHLVEPESWHEIKTYVTPEMVGDDDARKIYQYQQQYHSDHGHLASVDHLAYRFNDEIIRLSHQIVERSSKIMGPPDVATFYHPTLDVDVLIGDLVNRYGSYQMTRLAREWRDRRKVTSDSSELIDWIDTRTSEIRAACQYNARVKFVTAEETMGKRFPPPAFVCWPLFCQRRFTLIAGRQKAAGKTKFALAAVRALLSRSSGFFNHPDYPMIHTPIVYLYEGSEEEFNVYLHEAGFSSDSGSEDLHVLYRTTHSDLPWEETFRACITKAKQVGSEYIIIDTRDEWLTKEKHSANDAGDVRNIMRGLMPAKEAGIGVAILAHTTKVEVTTLENMAAGSAQWSASVDWIVGLWKDPELDSDTTQRIIECTGRMGIHANIEKSVISLDKDTGEYTWLGGADEVSKTSDKNLDIASRLEADRIYTLAELSEACEGLGYSPDGLRMRIKRSIERSEDLFLMPERNQYGLDPAHPEW